MRYPQREGLEYFICIYLPGFIIAVSLLIFASHEQLVHEILLKPTGENTDLKDYYTINSAVVLALYAFYFIAVPFIFGIIADGFKHSFIHFLKEFIHFLQERFKKWGKKNFADFLNFLNFLKWKFPNRAGYLEWVTEKSNGKIIFNENVYIRRTNKSYFLYHIYEFFANFAFSLVILSIVYFCYQIYALMLCNLGFFDSIIKLFSEVENWQIIIFRLVIITFLFILCILSMMVFWKGNEEICEDWKLYLEKEDLDNE